jgi:hypothetical protein
MLVLLTAATVLTGVAAPSTMKASSPVTTAVTSPRAVMSIEEIQRTVEDVKPVKANHAPSSSSESEMQLSDLGRP